MALQEILPFSDPELELDMSGSAEQVYVEVLTCPDAASSGPAKKCAKMTKILNSQVKAMGNYNKTAKCIWTILGLYYRGNLRTVELS